MWFPSFLQRRRSGKRRPAPRPMRARLLVEALESRLVPSGVDVVSGDPKDWPMYNHDPEGTRYNSAETKLRPDNVAGLEVLWSFPTEGPIAGTPAVVNDIVYAADGKGFVYAVTRDGDEVWRQFLPIETLWSLKVTASPLVTNRHVIVGDADGNAWGLDVKTGDIAWKTPLDDHPFAAVFSSATMVGKHVAIGVSSLEEVAALFPGYTDLNFRGSVVLLNPADGHIVWKTFTISDADWNGGVNGSSGSPIWSTPTYDRGTGLIYASTGNNYDQPTEGTSDAIIAFDARDGHIVWVEQKTPDDDWNLTFPDSEEHPDVDFGDSPQVYKLGGRKVVGAGQKSGVFHVVDAVTGDPVYAPPTQTVPGGQLGGYHMDTANAGGINFANVNHWPDPFGGGAPFGGSLVAVSGDGSEVLWECPTDHPNLSGVAVANGVVYMQNLFDGHLYVVDAKDGDLLAKVFSGGQSSGPSISRGQVYVGTGDVFSATFDPLGFVYAPGPGTITALGLPDKQAGKGARPSRPIHAEGAGTIDEVGSFFATGSASHLGDFTHFGTLVRTPTADLFIFTVTSVDAVYEADNGDQLFAILSATLDGQTGIASGTDTWNGGTGRFADASGTAAVTAQLLPDGTFTFSFVGDIAY